eukprot:1352206-Amorphochlora_amoeboformis.AAC.1
MYAYLWRVTNSNLRASDKMDGTHLCLEIVAVGCILAIHTSLGTYFQGGIVDGSPEFDSSPFGL